jgi:MFS family permease
MSERPEERATSRLPRQVVVMGWISFLADVGAELAYPVLPFLLTGPLQAPKAALGLVEGTAQLVISLSTWWAGAASDRTRRVPFIRLGYAFPTLARAAIAFAPSWLWVLGARTVDRVGKGMRTSPRDALLGDLVHPSQRGHAFGFHRAMDNGGSFVGALLAAAILWWFAARSEFALRSAFLVSAVLGLAAVALTFALREAPKPATEKAAAARVPLPKAYWRGLSILVLFALANSSDAFVLLRGAELGLAPWQVALAYAGFSAILSVVSTPLGRLSDRVGRWPIIATGVALYVVSYAGFALASSTAAFLATFALYGLSTGCTDGVRRALVVDHVPASERGRGLGIMHASVGAASLGSSLAAGLLWDRYGAASAFWLGAGIAILALIAILARAPSER